MGKQRKQWKTLFWGAPKSLQMVTAAMKLKDDQTRQHIKKQRHYFGDKGPYSQNYGFPSSHVWMLELDQKENWAPKNWCFWIVVLEKTLESTLDWKNIKPVNPKGNQSWIFIGRTDTEVKLQFFGNPEYSLEGLMLKLKLQYFGHLMERTDSFEKTLMLGNDWRRKEKGMTEDEMVGWHHQLNGHEIE